MERRIGSRARVDFPAATFVDGHRHECRAVDISSTGMVVHRSKSLAQRTLHELNAMELVMGSQRIRVRARTVWSRDRLHAVRVVAMNDVDRLDIAEHLDRMARLQSLH